MKKIIFAVLAILAVFVGIQAASTYNRLVPFEERVNNSYAEYQNQLKRQADLLPNMADVVKGYMNSEQKTMIDTAMARSGELARVKPSDVANSPELQKKLVEAQAAQGKAMVAINAVREAYPQLKADAQVSKLMVTMEGTQNRITNARFNNQKQVTEFNLQVRQFPGIMVAKLVGFSSLPYFAATQEEQNAPKLNFSK